MSTREFIRGEASLTPSLEGHVTRMGSVTTGQDRVCVCVCGRGGSGGVTPPPLFYTSDTVNWPSSVRKQGHFAYSDCATNYYYRCTYFKYVLRLVSGTISLASSYPDLPLYYE